MAIPADNPKIVYGATTLWLPKKFVEWERKKTHQPSVSEGQTYIQVVSLPIRYKIKATTDRFPDSTEDWDGSGAGSFLAAYATFWDSYAKTGKVWSFYRSATDSTAGVSYYQYCVWTGETDGTQLLIGNVRYKLTLEFSTETAAR